MINKIPTAISLDMELLSLLKKTEPEIKVSTLLNRLLKEYLEKKQKLADLNNSKPKKVLNKWEQLAELHGLKSRTDRENERREQEEQSKSSWKELENLKSI